MSSSTAPAELYNSPKRKRGAPDSIECDPPASPVTSPATIKPSECALPQKSIDHTEKPMDGSPSSKVTGQLRALGLQGTFVRQISFTDTGHTRPQSPKLANDPTSKVPLRNSSGEDPYGLPMTESTNAIFPGASSLNLENVESSPNIVDRPVAHNKSPPLEGNPKDNPTTWHESEITGHNPTDPNDDGYGINGIGFKPTPAIAWARYQKRKQQLADYKTREAREARQRRSERRRAGSREISPVKTEIGKKRRAKVRFGDTIGGHIGVE